MPTYAFKRLPSGSIKVTIDGDPQYIGMPVSIDPIGSNILRISPTKGNTLEINTDVDTITKDTGGGATTVTGTNDEKAEDLATDIFFLASGVPVDPNSPETPTHLWVGSQAEYDALTPDANTLYFIQ
jgi:hypothetical protein